MSREIPDWSSYNGVPDLGALLARHPNIAAVIIKATEGAWPNTNPYMDAQVAECRKHAIPYMFYTFWHPQFAGTADAQMLLDKIAGYQPAMVWFDCEVNDGLPANVIQGRLLEDIQLVALKYPMRTGIYSAPWWWDPNVGYLPQAYHYPFWVAGYTRYLPPSPAGFLETLLWQFTDSYDGAMDCSVFLGNDQQWAWLIHGTVPGPVPAPTTGELTMMPVITAADHTHPKALALWKERMQIINPGVDQSTDAKALDAAEQFRAYFKIVGDPGNRIGPAMWNTVMYLSTLEKK